MPVSIGSALAGSAGSQCRKPCAPSPDQKLGPTTTPPPGVLGAATWPGGSPKPATCVACIWALAENTSRKETHAIVAAASAVVRLNFTVLSLFLGFRLLRCVDNPRAQTYWRPGGRIQPYGEGFAATRRYAFNCAVTRTYLPDQTIHQYCNRDYLECQFGVAYRSFAIKNVKTRSPKREGWSTTNRRLPASQCPRPK